MPIPVSWPTIGGTPYSIPVTGETNWGALTNFLVALSTAQGTQAQKVAARVATSTPVTVTSPTDCVVVVDLTVPAPSTVILPPGVNGQFFNISDGKGDAGSNNITLFPFAGQTINNAPAFVINSNNDAIGIVFNSSTNNWKVTTQILSFSPGSVARNSIQAGTPNYVVINAPVTGLLSEEQFLANVRGGFGSDVSSFTGVVKASLGSFTASALVNADIDAAAAIDATKISTGIVSNSEFDRLNEIGLLYSTTKVTGGVGSVNGGNPALFDITSGTGKYTDYSGTPATPVVNDVSWGSFSAQTVTNLATADITWVLITPGGTILQTTTFPTPSQQRDNIFLMRINHSNRVSISFIDNIGNNSQSIGNQWADLVDALGSFNISGNVVSANGANLSFNKSLGSMFSRYFNQVAVPTNPHNIPTAATAPTTFQYRTRSTAFAGGNTTLVDPLNYDVGGVVTVIPGPAATSSIQRVYLFPSNNIRVQYGQNLYATLADAVSAVSTESFVINPANQGFAILIAYIVVQKSCVDLSAVTARILQAARFESGAGGGAGGSSTLQGAYSNSIAPILVLSAAPGIFRIRDNAVPLATSLFAVSNNAASTTYIDVSTQGIKGNLFPTTGRVIATDVNSAIAETAVTTTEVGYLAGATGVSGTGNVVRSISPVINTPDLDGGTASNTARYTVPKNTFANLSALTRKEGTILYSTDLDQLFIDDGITLTPLAAGNLTDWSTLINNLSFSATVAANALTFNLLTKTGATPSGSSPVAIGFRNSTLTSGTYNIRTVIASLSLVISSGSTLGQASAIAYPVYLYAIDNAGTVELAVSTTLFDTAGVISTTAEGGAGAADSINVMYSTTARASVPFRLIGKIISTQATAGTWASAPSLVATTMLDSPASTVIGSTNGAAIAAGYVGEILFQSRVRASAVALTSPAVQNVTVTAITLTPGVWLISGIVGFIAGVSTSVTEYVVGISKVSATIPASSTYAVPTSGENTVVLDIPATVSGGGDYIININPYVYSVAANTIIYLIGRAVFSVSTMTMYGSYQAVRIA